MKPWSLWVSGGRTSCWRKLPAVFLVLTLVGNLFVLAQIQLQTETLSDALLLRIVLISVSMGMIQPLHQTLLPLLMQFFKI